MNDSTIFDGVKFNFTTIPHENRPQNDSESKIRPIHVQIRKKKTQFGFRFRSSSRPNEKESDDAPLFWRHVPLRKSPICELRFFFINSSYFFYCRVIKKERIVDLEPTLTI